MGWGGWGGVGGWGGGGVGGWEAGVLQLINFIR